MTVSRSTYLHGIITLLFIACFVAGYSQSRKELILGNWIMEGKEYGSNRLIMRFNNDSTSIMEKWEGEKFILKLSFNYKLCDKDKFISLQPIDSGSRKWYVGVVELNRTTMKLRSQSPDSSLLVLTKLNK